MLVAAHLIVNNNNLSTLESDHQGKAVVGHYHSDEPGLVIKHCWPDITLQKLVFLYKQPAIIDISIKDKDKEELKVMIIIIGLFGYGDK